MCLCVSVCAGWCLYLLPVWLCSFLCEQCGGEESVVVLPDLEELCSFAWEQTARNRIDGEHVKSLYPEPWPMEEQKRIEIVILLGLESASVFKKKKFCFLNPILDSHCIGFVVVTDLNWQWTRTLSASLSVCVCVCGFYARQNCYGSRNEVETL